MKVLSLIENVRKISTLARQAFGEYSWKIVLLIVLAFISGILEGVGINTLIPLFSFAIGQEAAKDPLSKFIESIFSFFHVPFTVPTLLFFVISLFLLKTALSILFSYVSVSISSEYEERTRSKLFEKTLQSSWGHLLKQKLGHIEQVLLTDVQMSKNFLSIITTAIMTIINLVVYMVVALNISPSLTLFTFGLGFILIFALKPFLKKIQHLAFQEEQINKQVSHHMNETVLGMKSIKAMGVGDKVLEVGKNYFSRIRQMRLRSFLLSIGTSNLLQPASFIFVCLLFAFSYQQPDFNFVALVTLIYVIRQIFSYIERVQTHIIGVYANTPYLQSVLRFEQDADDALESIQDAGKFEFNKKIEFKNVDFSYSDKGVLKNLNFEAKRGEIIGIVGPSGAGKTTVVDLLLRLFSPSSGQILVDEKDIRGISLSEWRNRIGYVAQDVFLLNDTILNNIRFYNSDITNEQIEAAAKMANIYDFIMNTKEGFGTQIGERGVLLSGGQRQRIVLARILARNPDILVLDEATSALDNESEKKIQESIENLKGRMTVFIIAHRLSTVMCADKIMVLKEGNLLEMGAPNELLENKNSYFSYLSHIND